MNDKLLQYATQQGPLAVALGIFAFLIIKGYILTKAAMDTIIAAKDDKYREMTAAKDATIEAEQNRVTFRDQQISDREREIIRERVRADEKDKYVITILEQAKQAAEIANAALQAKRDADMAAAAAQAAHRRDGAR